MRTNAWVVLFGLALAPAIARADDAPDPTKDAARAKYVEGVALARNTQWSEALAAFEASAKLVPNAQTTVSIASCERALGRYVLARETFRRALAESAGQPKPLPDESVAEVRGFLDEIEHLLAHATVTIEPVEAAIVVDGRPLAVLAPGARPELAAGMLPPGPGRAAPAGSFDLVLDPGAHVFTVSRKGFQDVVVNESFAPASTHAVDLHLDRLSATLRVTASPEGSLVRVDERDVGPVPVDVRRPAGSYKVVVEHEGFVPYTTHVDVQAGEETAIRAALVAEKPSILKKWWFWTAAGVVVAGGVTVTYFATRPKPSPPPYEGGSANWVVQPTGLRF